MRARLHKSLPFSADGRLDVDQLLTLHRRTFGDARMTSPAGGDGGAGGSGGDGGGAGDAGGGQGGSGTGGGSGSGSGGNAGGQSGTGGAAGSEKGFPENTPVAEMTAEQAAAYWKFQSRKHEQTAKDRSDYDDLKRKATEYDALVEASATEQEKAVKAAKDEGRSEALPGLVRAEFKAASAGRIEPDALKEILEPLDLTKFLTAKGEVDEAKVQKYVDGIVPAGAGRGTSDLGQGRRGSSGKAGLGERGREQAQKRFGKPAGQQ